MACRPRLSLKPGFDEPALEFHHSKPERIFVFLAMSFERDSDIERIESFLCCFPDVKVLSVSVHPAPMQAELDVLGVLRKYWPSRYEHIETDFHEERGLERLAIKLSSEGLTSSCLLDYAWLQSNYYKEQGRYGMNWLPMKIESYRKWTDGKVLRLLKAGVSEFFLPVDIGGNAVEMILRYERSISADRASAPRVRIDTVSMQRCRKFHPLVRSDFSIAEKLTGMARDPEMQINRYLNPLAPFVHITPWADKGGAWPPAPLQLVRPVASRQALKPQAKRPARNRAKSQASTKLGLPVVPRSRGVCEHRPGITSK